MFVLIYGDDSDGLYISYKLFGTYEEAYKVMHDDWLEMIQCAGWDEKELTGEDSEPYCLMWQAEYAEYDEFDCSTSRTEWQIVDASKEG